MKNRITRWSEAYHEIFRDTRLLTQAFAFAAAVALLTDAARAVYLCLSTPDAISANLKLTLTKELAFYLLFAVLLSLRFALLFFKDAKYFWLSQLVWLTTYLLLVSQISLVGCTKNAFPIFREALSYIFVAYLFLSPVRQLTTLLVSFGRISDK